MSGRSVAFRLLPSLTRMLPLSGLIGITGQKVIFPFYHLVADANPPHIKHLYKVRTTKEFIRDLDLFLEHYKPIGIDDLLDSLKTGRKIRNNSFLLSFDDGLREFHDVAAPILLKKGIPAICFLNSAFLDNAGLFYRYKASLLIEMLQNTGQDKKKILENWFGENHLPYSNNYSGLLRISYANRHLLDELATLINFNFNDYLETVHPYLESSQVTSLIKQGFSFGAHSIDHPEYRFLPEDEQIRQTTVSIKTITEKFGLGEKLFSFPFTDFGVKKSFFDTVFDPLNPIADLTFGGAGLKTDSVSRNIQRIPFEGTFLTAKQILGTEYLYFGIKSIFGKNLIRR